MAAQSSGKSNSMIFLVLVLVAMIGYNVAAYYSTTSDINTLRAQMEASNSRNKEELASLGDQIQQRYLTVLKLAQSIDQQEAKMTAIDRSITAEREALSQIEDNFHGEVSKIEKLGTDSTTQVANLGQQFNQEIKVKELKLAKLQDEYSGIKNQLEDQQTLLVMMREQSLLDKYKQPGTGRPLGDQNAPGAGTSLTPANPAAPLAPLVPDSSVAATPVAPANLAPTTLVPANNRVVTDLPSPSALPAASATSTDSTGSK